MTRPTTREQLKQYCLRELGAPVTDINVDDEQLEDRIDEAIDYWTDYHYDGTEHTYLKHQITQTDINNKYITIPEAIKGIIRIFDMGSSVGASSLFNIRYEIHLNELYDFSSASITPYYMSKQHINMLQEIFTGKNSIRFNRHTDRLYIDFDWEADVTVGKYVIIDCYQAIDPDVYTDMWSDRWLLKYTTQLFKRQWGTNMKKFGAMQLPGGITLNGQEIYQEAQDEIRRMEEEMISAYSLPVTDMIG